ncbi:hypothetical protein [Truepera radiovictrix]|nr:hypothetical protein [Truepera radiovictrix]WMT56005.1 hypothetical protein RCV51_08255 [Truepera radiovictrix]
METMILFYECAGPEARGRLEALQTRLAEGEGYVAGTLLQSADQPELYLLTSTWRANGAPQAAPEGVKVWRFRPVAPEGGA